MSSSLSCTWRMSAGASRGGCPSRSSPSPWPLRPRPARLGSVARRLRLRGQGIRTWGISQHRCLAGRQPHVHGRLPAEGKTWCGVPLRALDPMEAQATRCHRQRGIGGDLKPARPIPSTRWATCRSRSSAISVLLTPRVSATRPSSGRSRASLPDYALGRVRPTRASGPGGR